MVFYLNQQIGSSFASLAHGRVGARATIQNVSAPPPAEKIHSVQQAGKKKRGCGGNEFLPACSAPKVRQGWEAARPCISKEAKPAKIVSLIEKNFCARPLKNVSIFAGFARRQAASRGGGFLPVRAEIVAQNRFALRSVIAGYPESNRDYTHPKDTYCHYTISQNLFYLNNFSKLLLNQIFNKKD